MRLLATRPWVEDNLGRAVSRFSSLRKVDRRAYTRFRERLQIYGAARSVSCDAGWEIITAFTWLNYLFVDMIHRIVCRLLEIDLRFTVIIRRLTRNA